MSSKDNRQPGTLNTARRTVRLRNRDRMIPESLAEFTHFSEADLVLVFGAG
jgi:hypothetical protein